jgi:fumarate hydratase class I
MATPPFTYQDPLPLGPTTPSTACSPARGVSTATFEGREILKVAPETLAYLARQAFHDTSFLLRTAPAAGRGHPRGPRGISNNDRYVALTLLKNAEIAAQGILPMCQDTGTAAVWPRKASRSGPAPTMPSGSLAASTSAYTKENLRYSQTAPLDMWKEVNTGTNLPAQIDLTRRGRQVRIPLRRQGRRLRQQDVPLPGNQGAAQPEELRKVRR